MFKLELMRHNLVLKEYTLTDGAILMIGRHSANDIVLRDISVSRHHATIEGKGRKLLIFDHRSKNGTTVNDMRVQSAQLRHGDIVKIGKDHIIKVAALPKEKKESTITVGHDPRVSPLKKPKP